MIKKFLKKLWRSFLLDYDYSLRWRELKSELHGMGRGEAFDRLEMFEKRWKEDKQRIWKSEF